jgi:chromosome segregation protein
MLKALELVGFKSFAAKTRFEFSQGITVVVGPNGSGKSNIVDAIKWVLGEQSVKSLRGTEMADVIFNGSGSRRAMNSAEVTLTFDNSSGMLAVDSSEVHITRRVYRGGEGEYLINRQPCRLRDIRDLLSGTGLGTNAYSVIEQGKVDVLLQASPRDRRAIFEEAAGISRFKAKKLEALRRLERVEHNLLRLSDIVDEVENRLKSVRMQAGKARRYKAYADRLQELRTQVGLVDWRKLTESLTGLEGEIDELHCQRDAASAEAEVAEVRLLEAETQIGDTNEAIRQSEARIAANRERIAANESTIEHERARSRDLEHEITRHRQQLAAMSLRAGDLDQQLGQTQDAVHLAEEHHRDIARRFAQGERELTELIHQIDQLRGENHRLRETQMERMRSAASLESQISGFESRVAAALAARERSTRRLTELDAQLDALGHERRQLDETREELSRHVNRRHDRLLTTRARLDQWQKQVAAKQAELSHLRQRQSGLAERSSILDELQRRHEGVSPGVKDVLQRARTAGDGPFRHVRGLLADLLHVGVESAALVEVALGETAQHVVVGGGREMLHSVQEESARFAGRVGFLWIDDGPRKVPVASPVDLEGLTGVLGRADRFVETTPELAPLVERLLGQTWIVEKLSHALALAEGPAAGVSLVTLAGELLDVDGTLVVGPRHVSAGLISRRSELRALESQLVEIEGRITDIQTAARGLEEKIVADQREASAMAEEHQKAADALSRHSHKITTAQERDSQLRQHRAELAAELEEAIAGHDSACQALAQSRSGLQEIESGLADAESRLSGMDDRIDRLEADRQVRNRETTEIKVELAKSEERLRNLRGRMRQFEDSQQERRRAIDESQARLAECIERARRSRWNILNAETDVADLYLRKEAFARHTVELMQKREDIHAQRSQFTRDAQSARARARKSEEKTHTKDLAANEIRHERNGLADRLREDYGIELAQLEHKPTGEEQRQREEVDREIDDLRRKINNLGHVNVESLEELQQLDTRYTSLSTQHKDLVDAKNSLQRIIDKINTDSRRLFVETLETVTGHFCELFRQLFGGGKADIVLDEDEDILESGIEIVARPPGKELRSISLLSGGEKTLTCVALLLAIFRSRPSPFCVLDEVDAALDEANIDRFTKVLDAFLAWTQFIIVTHSKKTMTCADSIYGVTMQESGVSKQVSVRFEDVSEDGHIQIPPRSDDAPRAEDQAVDDDDEPQAA